MRSTSHNDVGFWVILILVQDIHFFDVLMARNALEHALFKSAQVDIARIDVIRFLVNFDTQRFARMGFLGNHCFRFGRSSLLLV